LLGKDIIECFELNGEPTLSISRSQACGNWMKGDLSSINDLISSLKNKDLTRITKIIFCQRYRPKDGRKYELIEDLETMVSGPLRLLELADVIFPRLRSVIFISSPAASYVAEEQPIGYHITRSAIESMVRYTAVMLSSRDIAVNAIRLGYVKMNIVSNNKVRCSDTDQIVIPRGFAPSSDEIARAIYTMTQIDTSVMTGQIFAFDAGLGLRTHASLADAVRFYVSSNG